MQRVAAEVEFLEEKLATIEARVRNLFATVKRYESGHRTEADVVRQAVSLRDDIAGLLNNPGPGAGVRALGAMHAADIKNRMRAS